jgi:catecholate siderophore receptor
MLSNDIFRKSALALAISMTASSYALADQAKIEVDDDEVVTLDTISVKDRTLDTNPYAEENAPYKAKISGDRRHVKDLADTPQTINVMTQTQIQESGKTDLKEVLSQQPGITIGTGENGNAFGDRYIIRGHEARSSVYVDGVRDPGMTTRESFATEQIEVTKGPSSTFAGRGSTGGAVNGITKQASTEYDFTQLDLGVGTDRYQRVTVDSNQKVNDDIALRANILHAYEQVPDRNLADKERTGALLSGSFTPTEKLKLLVDGYYLKSEDTPDTGTYIEPLALGGKPVDDIPVYLQKDRDFLNSDANSLTFKVNYDFSDDLSLQNTTRYGMTKNGYITTGIRGGVRDATDPDAPSAATLTLSTHNGWQNVDYITNQTNLFLDKEFGDTKHQFVFGAEYSQEDVLNGVYKITNNGATNCVLPGRGANPPSASYCALDENGSMVSNINTLLDSSVSKGAVDSDYHIDTISLYAMDTITFDDHWSTFFGLRYDYFDYKNIVTGRAAKTRYQYSDGFWSGHIGAVYNITDEGNIYLTYSTATEINGGESDVGGSCGYGGVCGSPDLVKDGDPETTQNIEFGTKWDVLDEKLLVTAAIFEMRKTDVMESAPGNDYSTVGSVNTGINRVRGIEFSLTGNITDSLSAQFGAAFMDAEVVKSNVPAYEGLVLSNFAENSAFLQLRYQLTRAFSFGGGATYSGEMYAGQPDTAAGYDATREEYSYTVPDYTVYDLFASYEVNKQLNIRFNVNNVTDEDYYLAAYRSGSFTYIGDARNAHITVSYKF